MSEIIDFDSIPHLIGLRARLDPHCPAMFDPAKEGQWQMMTWAEVDARVNAAAKKLCDAGIKAGECVGIHLPNCSAWEVLNLAVLRIGAVVVGFDVHEPAQRLGDIFDISQPTAFFTQRADQVPFITPSRFASLRIAGCLSPDMTQGWQIWDLSQSSGDEAAFLPPLPSPHAPATLVFTSGTTGNVKGIEYTQAQLKLAALAVYEIDKSVPVGTRLLCWLPLASLYQRVSNLCGIIIRAEIYFWSDHKHIMDAIKAVSPDIFIGIPRLYEKVWSGIERRIDNSAWPLRLIVKACIGIGGVRARRLRERRKIGRTLNLIYFIADRIVLSKIRKVMGKRIKYVYSGSAAMPLRLLEQYHAIGILILEAYGLSENIVPMAMNSPVDFRFGTVGRPLPHNEIVLNEQGVVQVRGPGVFKGYYHDPSTHPFTKDGFYITGDLGDMIGPYIHLKGRQSELIKTSTGRRIAPSNIEMAVKGCPFIEQAVAFGNEHKRLIAVVTINAEALAAAGLRFEDEPSVALNQAFLKELTIAAQDLPSHERPAGYIILEHPFSIVSGEITASQKLRRRNIEERYGPWINLLFKQTDAMEGKDVVLKFVSEAKVRQARFDDVTPQTQLISGRFARAARLATMTFNVVILRLIDFLPKLHVGEAAQVHYQQKQLKRIGAIISNELAYLKGPAAKLGQMASYVTSTVPEPIRRSLGKLLSGAVPLSSTAITQIVEASFGRPMDAMFSHWEEIPLAVASMSQVHRARLKTGEDVAVKVLFPENRTAINADVNNLRLIFPLLGNIMGIANGNELMDEFWHLFQRECDLKQEAEHQETFRRLFSDNPKIIIPRVFREFTSKEVLTMEYISGVPYDQFKLAATQQEKNRAAEIIGTMMTVSIAKYGIFNADPHPGNYLFVGDKVCFLDFGFVQRWPKHFIDLWKRQSLAGARNDLAEFTAVSKELGFEAEHGEQGFANLMAQYQAISYTPWKEDRLFRMSREFNNANLGKLFNYRSRIGSVRIPPQYAAISRLFMGTVTIDLEAELNWHRIIVPLLEGPTVSLGESIQI